MQDMSAICFHIDTDVQNQLDLNNESQSTKLRKTAGYRKRGGVGKTSHSCGSLLSSMDKFVQTVDEMNEIILIPSRLMDLKSEKTGTDLYLFYSVLNNVKNDLMWSHCGNISNNVPQQPQSSSLSYAPPTTATTAAIPNNANNHYNNNSNSSIKKGHARTPSTVSNLSLQSDNTDFSESNSSTDGIDSGVDEDVNQQITDTFKLHLHGLQSCLKELTFGAEDVISRYSSEIGMDEQD